jgi:hypothetical protein
MVKANSYAAHQVCQIVNQTLEPSPLIGQQETILIGQEPSFHSQWVIKSPSQQKDNRENHFLFKYQSNISR